MDGDLHLLMLMHRQLEEARALGNAGPRLEYSEEPALFKVRVPGMDAVEEVGYGGAHRFGEMLRRLETEGYVELERSDPDASSGFITITDKALQRIRYRRTFESNLPRSFGRWEISLLGIREITHMRLWKANWEGREITVRNRRVLVGKGNEPITEYLNVDRRFPPAYRIEKSGAFKDLYGELRAADGVHEVHARIGPTAPFRRTGCLVAVDGVVIGGDVGKRFLT